jgi:hypothetical protein
LTTSPPHATQVRIKENTVNASRLFFARDLYMMESNYILLK